MDTDAKFGGPLHIEALPDQQQVLVLDVSVCAVLCYTPLRCAMLHFVLCCACHAYKDMQHYSSLRRGRRDSSCMHLEQGMCAALMTGSRKLLQE